MNVIGVSPCFMYPDAKRKIFSKKNLAYIENDMACYLTRPDVLPLLIPDLPQEKLLPLLDKCAGFIFQGGSDIAPSSYHSEPLNTAKWPGDPYRDEVELNILDYAVTHKRPILGICRGCQLINVYFGGTLYQDIATEISAAMPHRNAQQYDLFFHEIAINKNSYLASIYPETQPLFVNSVHHQGIKKLGTNLKIEAISKSDKIIEAISSYAKNLNFILGVQWHPEFSHTLKNKLINPEPLYELFLQSVKSQ